MRPLTRRVVLTLSSLALIPLGGCIGATAPVAGLSDPAPRIVRVPVAPASGGGQARMPMPSTLILGVQ